eukprot:364838-Chlamydomonas_euryale.AAC.11
MAISAPSSCRNSLRPATAPAPAPMPALVPAPAPARKSKIDHAPGVRATGSGTKLGRLCEAKKADIPEPELRERNQLKCAHVKAQQEVGDEAEDPAVDRSFSPDLIFPVARLSPPISRPALPD